MVGPGGPSRGEHCVGPVRFTRHEIRSRGARQGSARDARHLNGARDPRRRHADTTTCEREVADRLQRALATCTCAAGLRSDAGGTPPAGGLCVFGEAFTQPYQLMAACAFLTALSGFRMTGLYRWDGGRSRLATITRVAGAWACVAALLAALGHATGLLQEMQAGVLLAWGFGVPASMALMHGAAAAGMRALRARGLAGRTAVVVGAGPIGSEFAQRVQDEPACGIRLVGFFDDRRPSGGTSGLPLLGSLSDLADYVRANATDHIYIALPAGRDGRIAKLIERLHDTTSSVSFLPQVLSASVPTLHIEEVAGVPLFTSCDTPFADWGRRLVKRASDIAIASFGLLIAAPIMAAVAVAVKVTSPGPVLFRQRRHGLDGKEIVIYKFRTMSIPHAPGPRHRPHGRALRRPLTPGSRRPPPLALRPVRGPEGPQTAGTRPARPPAGRR